MCGLSLLLSPAAAPPGLIAAMTAIVAHRGPDGCGHVSGDSSGCRSWEAAEAGCPGMVSLGHRRLAVVDTSASGAQPMSSADGLLWIVYNGEVYNHQELREELRRDGAVFHTRTDTEVVLAAYARWGEDCLDRFEGMWAMVIWDRARGRVFLARDRFGIKPLYYWLSPEGRLAAASEIKQFTVLPGWEARPAPRQIYDFLAWGLTDHGEGTCFRGVFQLPPGGCVTLSTSGWCGTMSGGRLPVKRWYVAHAESGADVSDAEIAARLEASVVAHLGADVQVGSCLSGGVDSSAIVCLAHRFLQQRGGPTGQATVSSVTGELASDESRWIDIVVGATGVSNHRVMASAEGLFAELPALAWHQDEPFAGTSIYAQWCVFRRARQAGITVMLDGQGADEVFAGYPHASVGPHLAALLRSGRLLELLAEAAALRQRMGLGWRYSLPRALLSALPPVQAGRLRRRDGGAAGAPSWLSLQTLGIEAADPYLNLGSRRPDLASACLAQVTATSLPMLLRWEDRNSMASGIEARVPFLDHRVVEAGLGLAPGRRLRRGVTKLALRQAMRGIVPGAILDRRDKIGFATPEERWLRRDAPGQVRRAVREAVEIGGGILSPAACDLAEHVIDGRRAFDHVPWRIISFGAWMRRFSVRM